jgi:hypothetical protein
MTGFWIGLAVGGAGGFATCWFTKDRIIALFVGTANLARSLEAKSAALRAKL